MPFHYRPFYGVHKGKDCQGVMIVVTDPKTYRPVSHPVHDPRHPQKPLPQAGPCPVNALEPSKKELFCKASGNDEMLALAAEEQYVAWKLILFQKEEREQFLKERIKYLLY